MCKIPFTRRHNEIFEYTVRFFLTLLWTIIYTYIRTYIDSVETLLEFKVYLKILIIYESYIYM